MGKENLEYEDDFLDSLMEEVMGDSNEVESESSHNIDSVEDDLGEASVPNPSPLIESSERRRRPGGLLGQLGGESREPISDTEPTKEVDNAEPTKEVDNAEPTKEVDNAEPKVSRRSLLSKVDEDSSGIKNPFSSGVETVGDESLTEDRDLSSNEEEESISEVESNVNDEQSSSVNDEDLLEDMLESLSDEEDIEAARERAELDPEVEVPLEKPGMDEIIVTSDGRSLADMLPGLRGGKKTIDKVVSDIRNQENVVEVQGNKFSDNRYVKHANVIDEEKARDDERVALSMKYLQKNAKFTEQEKIIMRNLGLTSEQLSKVMKSQELTKKEKKELIALGRYGSEKLFKGRRYRTTVGDAAMLEFLVKFKFANTRILRWISNEPQGRTWRKLNRLRDSGLVESKSLIGVPDLWGATPSGVAISGYAHNPGLRPMPKMFTISSNMGVNYIAACLWFNSVNVLNLDDFPAKNRIISLQEDGRDRVRGEMLVSEYEIRSSLGKEINPQSSTMKTLGDERLYDVISSNVRREFEIWEEGGKLGESPESTLGNEYMWILFPTSQLTLSYHVPDLVVKRERGPNGEPRSIAVEVERYDKSNDRYDKIMLAYKLDEHLYEKVVWITPNTRVARALERAAKEVGFDRYTIIPIITETGVYDKQDIWMI